MVTFSPERGVVPFVRVAVKVTDWLTAGVELVTERESWVGVAVGVGVGVAVGVGVGVAVGVGVGVGSTAVTVTVAVRLFTVWFDGLMLLNVMMVVPCLMP